jgi:hypothetical protein
MKRLLSMGLHVSIVDNFDDREWTVCLYPFGWRLFWNRLPSGASIVAVGPLRFLQQPR